jgi:dTDP-L-rhamnose 4-epimerase
VHIDDVVQAFIKALETDAVTSGAFNIGSGESISIRQVAERLAAAMGRRDITPIIMSKARTGDIRHCFADIALARDSLGYAPMCNLDDGMAELAAWVRRQQAIDRASQAHSELEVRGLVA